MQLTEYQPLIWLVLLIPLCVGMYFSLVDRPRWMKVASFACRVLGILFLVLALCRPYISTKSDWVHVVFLLDVSESVELKDVEQALKEVERGVKNLRGQDSYSLFALGDGVRRYEVEAFKQNLEVWHKMLSDQQFRSATKLASGLLTSQIDFPAGKARKVVVFTDGQGTHGDIQEAVEKLRLEKVEVNYFKLAGLGRSEAVVSNFEALSRTAFYGEIVRMVADVAANKEMEVKVRLLHKGVLAQEKTLTLVADKVQEVYFDVEMLTPGASVWQAELVASDDYFSVNNQMLTTVVVKGKPRILLLHREPSELRPFARSLGEQGFEVESRGLNGLPVSIDELLAFDSVILSDYPATEMGTREMELLRRYVAEFGGSLGMFGSENSFGLGGYFKTPVEEVLPLVSRFEKEKEKPSLAMVLVIDKSGSMKGVPIALARQAAKATVDVLTQRDQIAVIGFDSAPLIVSDLRPASEAGIIQAAIDSLGASGGTNLYPAMLVGKEMLENVMAKVKHMIVLTDGKTKEADHASLAQSMVDAGITVSGVALGADADRVLLSRIAEIGNGRYYETMDPSTVPQIFTKDTMQASKSAIKEDLVQAVQVADHPMFVGYSDDDFPYALGYVMTQPKPTAQVLLVTDSGDPLLALSRFGLGVGLAYTSNMTEQWGGEWLAWSECGRFWAQALRSIIRRTDVQGFEADQRVVGDTWVFNIDRNEVDGMPLSQVDWDAEVLDASGQMEKVKVQEVGLGRYQLKVPLQERQNLTLRVHDRGSDKLRTFHYHRPYPLEYRLSGGFSPELEKTEVYSADRIREGLEAIPQKGIISHYAYFLGFFLLCLGVLLRRI